MANNFFTSTPSFLKGTISTFEELPSPPSDYENQLWYVSSGSGGFTAWDRVSIVNLGLTGFKVSRTSGTVVAKISVRTASV